MRLVAAVSAPILAALVLAGCTSTVSGHAQGALPTSPTSPTSTGPTPTDPTPTTSTSGGVTADIGDPLTADLCHDVPLADLHDYGTARVDDAQIAGSCYLIISKSGAPTFGVDVTAMPPKRAQPTNAGVSTTVEGLLVVQLHPTSYSCERDIWAGSTVLAVSGQDLGTSTSGQLLCQLADQVTTGLARSLRTGPPPRRPVASPSVTSLDLCRGMGARDLAKVPGGGVLVVAPVNYKTFCRGTSNAFTLGAQAVLRKATVKSRRHVNVGGHPLDSFQTVTAGSVICEVSSVQKPTSDPSLIEAIDFYLLAKSAPLRGQRLCSALATEAATVLSRLGLK